MNLSLARLRDSQRAQEILGLMLLALSVLSLLSVASYTRDDPNWFHSGGAAQTSNWIGAFGANWSEALLQLFGVVAFAVPPVLLFLGWAQFRHREEPTPWLRFAGYGLLTLTLAALLDLLFGTIAYGGEQFAPGGALGRWVAGAMVSVLNRTGAILVVLLMIASTIVLVTRFSFSYAADVLSESAAGVAGSAGASVKDWWQSGRNKPTKSVSRRKAATKQPEPEPEDDAYEEEFEERSEPNRASIPVPPTLSGDAEVSPAPPPAAPRAAQPAGPPRVEKRTAGSAPRKPRQTALPLEQKPGEYALPDLDLLNEPKAQDVDNEAELLERAQQLTEKFHTFNVDGSVVAIHPGPVVTTFEFKPEAGVKYSKIAGMSDDLCLALRAESVRIDRMPGKSTVGIEVPNRQQETIFMRELLGSERFQESRSKLTLSLGKDIGGQEFTAELERMPHLLIAGATGAGKSVMLNGMIVSMLYKATPHDVRFIMIDTKRIELGIYADIPHLLVPVVTDPKQASAALKWAVREMEIRYRKLAAVGVRNIDQFNTLLEKEPDRTMETDKGEEVPLSHLPFIVIVIDEMADLMIVAAGDVEESVMRLAQMARAVGIHLILATQRPSVDVITGTIKANFPSRIAFRVSQRVDSRTIIDQQGAERLLGRGDMLYLPSGSSRLQRLHSGFITEEEINRVTDSLKEMADPVYDETVLKDPEENKGPGGDGDEEFDSMYTEAVRTILTEGSCSITLIQRRLRLGYARAARIVDMMERQGAVGPADGSKPREILVGQDYLDELEASP